MPPPRYLLLVEDNPDDAELTLRALHQAGISQEIVVARDGAEAADLLDGAAALASGQARSLPAVILLDLKLPRVDGLELLRRIRAGPDTARLPVVVLSTSHEERDLIESYRLGANSYVVKPLEFEKFIDTVGKLGRYWLFLNETPRSGPVLPGTPAPA